MHTTEIDNTITVAPSNPNAKWVALDANNKVIAEGDYPNKVIEDAKKITSDYTIMFVPAKGNTYIF